MPDVSKPQPPPGIVSPVRSQQPAPVQNFTSPQQTQQPVSSQIPPRRKSNTIIIIALTLFIIVGSFIIGAFIFYAIRDSDNEKIKQSLVAKPTNEPVFVNASPSPFPFQEMTLPYLRAREYKSKLGSLEKVASNGDYGSYLTSYDSDGLKINGLLTKPAGEAPAGGWPAIVFIHGYIPPTQYETNGQSYAAYVDYLARNGFVVFKIDLRGHDESDGSPSGAYYSPDYIIDTLNAYAALQSSGFVEPGKIGIWGHSMAGNISLRSFAVKPDIAAVVIWGGAGFTYEDLQKYRINDASYQVPANDSDRQKRRRELFEKYGSPSAQVKFWQEVSPATYLKDLKGAVQLHHAVDDDVVNIGYSRDLNELLDETSVKHQLFEYTGGGHNISGESFNQAMQRTVGFFKEHLK